MTSARAMIDWAYPKSLHVISAVWRAQLDGLIAGSAHIKPAPSIMGNYATAAHVLRRLGEKISSQRANPASPSVSLVLIGPVLWTRFSAGGDRSEPQIHTGGPAPGDVVVVTDEPVIEALLDGRLTADTAENKGLIRYYGSPTGITAIRTLLGKARAAGRSTSSL
ncbi:MAG: hypothetical protein K2Q28_03155 [Hyphomicrobium sp.]|nr:hypothetical protein [Hyphomicrobium sp.]